MKDVNKYIEILLLILVSFSPLLSQPLKAALVLVLLIINYKYLSKFTKNNAVILSIFISIFILGLIFDLRNIESLSQMNILNLYFPLCILLGYVVSRKYRLNDFFEILDEVIMVLVIFSLLGVLVYTLVPNLVRYLPNYNYYHTTHKTAFIFNILTTPEGVLKRNAGIAWEPGVFQFIANLGLYSYLKTANKVKLSKVMIYSIAIIATQSTAGILIFIIITFKLFLEDKKARIILLLSILFFGGIIMDELTYQYKYKLFGSSSFQNRSDPLVNAFKVGSRHPLGLGNSGFDIFYGNGVVPPWDSYGQVFVRYGYFLLVFIVICLSKLIKNNKVLFIILIVTFSSQNIWFFPIVTPFYFSFRKEIVGEVL